VYGIVHGLVYGIVYGIVHGIVYGIVCFTCISINSLVHTVFYLQDYKNILMHVKHTIPYLYIQPNS